MFEKLCMYLELSVDRAKTTFSDHRFVLDGLRASKIGVLVRHVDTIDLLLRVHA